MSLDTWTTEGFEDCCSDDRIVAQGKIPDPEGRVPSGGAY
jgi:hypothetical protein